MPLTPAQTAAIISADTVLREAALPSYSDLLDLVKRSAHLLAESSEANESRVVYHRSELIAAIKSAAPAYYGN